VLINIHKIPREASDQSWRGAIPVSIGLYLNTQQPDVDHYITVCGGLVVGTLACNVEGHEFASRARLQIASQTEVVVHESCCITVSGHKL
jgi:hypothetical protein